MCFLRSEKNICVVPPYFVSLTSESRYHRFSVVQQFLLYVPGQDNFYLFDQKNVSLLSCYILRTHKKNLTTRKVILI